MVVPAKGLFYSVSPPPLSGNPEIRATRLWCLREFERIAFALSEGAVQSLRLNVLEQLPDKPMDGMVAYFLANVVSPGSGAGSYEYRSGAWTKL